MGSSLTTVQATILAIGFGVFYLLFDALRFFVNQAGPVRIRRWTAESEGENGGTFAQSVQQFTLITGTLLQICLVTAVAFSLIALSRFGLLRATLIAIAIWCVISILWKIGIAFLPESIIEKIVVSFLPVSRFLYYIFWPLVFPLRTLMERIETKREEHDVEEEITDEEVQAYIDVGEEEGILEAGEGKLIQQIVDFGDRIAKELMTPRIDMLAFDSNGSLQELARLFSESKYSRIPIHEGNIDKIVGIIHIKDLFDAFLTQPNVPVRSLARPAYFVPETKKVSDLLRELQVEHMQVAIVVDEYGGTAGLVTIEDIIEQIVGDIADEHEDSDESIVEIDNDVFLVNGPVKIETLEEKLDVELASDDYETVAGLIFTAMGRVPKIGETIKQRGLIFEVEKADRKRIYRVKVTRDPDYDKTKEEEDE
jgi:CBS domain containing-hemolysin-like protein